ncbi:MAG: hypothetical protein E6L08_06030 [Verrucomicrobia bacterium]|nr:MAG: hypothetical protein DMF26_15465 [Verrucomicrobiota bacterium]TMP93293.1 MAG: hypothetical protein E6L08_06030 [Verrucomicrobiota bacterium]
MDLIKFNEPQKLGSRISKGKKAVDQNRLDNLVEAIDLAVATQAGAEDISTNVEASSESKQNAATAVETLNKPLG